MSTSMCTSSYSLSAIVCSNKECVRLRSTFAHVLSSVQVNPDARVTVTVHDEPVSEGDVKILAGQE